MVAEPQPLMESVPISELGAPPPKRGRGRPRKLDENGQPVAPAPRRSARRKPSPRARSAAPKSLYPEIAATLSMVNMIVVMTPLGSRVEYADPDTGAIMPGRVGDELDVAEITMLAQSLDTQCQRSPRFRKQVERILGVGSAGTLITTLGMIAARRASRHGILPDMLDPMLGAVMAGGDLNALASFVPPAVVADAPDPMTGESAPMPLGDDDIGSYEGL